MSVIIKALDNGSKQRQISAMQQVVEAAKDRLEGKPIYLDIPTELVQNLTQCNFDVSALVCEAVQQALDEAVLHVEYLGDGRVRVYFEPA